ncbi:MAG: chain length determinant protein tyrosine kinase EpsG [Pseudomonadota bacterium]
MNHPAHPLTPPLSPHDLGPDQGADSRIGALLLASGKLGAADAERVLRLQQEAGVRFGEAAVRLGLINEADIEHVLARQFAYPYLQRGEHDYSPLLVAAYEPFSPQVEQIRAVRSHLMLRWFGRGHKSLVVLGVDSGDGASLFAANLAVVFSQLGEATLLVDANLRKPRQHTVFDLGAGPGLSDLLAGRAGLDGLVARIAALDALSVLRAGTLPPNPQELLSRQRFGALSVQLEERYAIVLYDAAAHAHGSDALAVAARAGGALLVARKDKTRLADVNHLAERIVGCGAHVVGSVVVDF